MEDGGNGRGLYATPRSPSAVTIAAVILRTQRRRCSVPFPAKATRKRRRHDQQHAALFRSHPAWLLVARACPPPRSRRRVQGSSRADRRVGNEARPRPPEHEFFRSSGHGRLEPVQRRRRCDPRARRRWFVSLTRRASPARRSGLRTRRIKRAPGRKPNIATAGGSKQTRRSVQRAACGDGVGRRAWLRSACHAPRRERRRAEAIAVLAGMGIAEPP